MNCILFVCLELLRGHYRTAVLHLHNGWNILDYLAQSKSKEKYVGEGDVLILPDYAQTVEDSLIEIFARLGIQATNFRSNAPMWTLLPSTSAGASELQIPVAFGSQFEARQNLDALVNAIARFLSIAPDPAFHNDENVVAVTQRNTLLSKLRSWSSAFSAYTTTPNHSSNRHHRHRD
jgi:hypothetical protein